MLADVSFHRRSTLGCSNGRRVFRSGERHSGERNWSDKRPDVTPDYLVEAGAIRDRWWHYVVRDHDGHTRRGDHFWRGLAGGNDARAELVETGTGRSAWYAG